MTPFRQSFSWWCFENRGVDAEVLLREAAAIGYDGVELIPVELWPAAKDEGLAIASHMCHSIELGFNDRAMHAELQGKVRGGLDVCAKAGAANLIVFSGNRRAGVSDADGAAITAEGLAPLAKDAEDAGVTLIIELLNSKVDHIGYQCDHSAWAIDVCRKVGSPRLRALYDIYHMQIMEGDLIRTIQDDHQWFAHYHTAGNPGRHDIDDQQEIFYPPIYRAIAATGYTGFIGHEFVPKGAPVPALRKAYDDCVSALEGVSK